jgi:microcystin-dependent protein
MAEPFIGEVRMWGLTFAPQGWMFCNGGLLPINQNQALYSLIGTTFGGNGTTTFAVPELRGRVPMHVGSSGPQQGLRAGAETVTLTPAQMPAHTHDVRSSSQTGDENAPAGHIFAAADGAETYAAPANLVKLNANTVSNAGGGQGHENRQPTLAINFTIALQGLFPSRN